MVTPLELIRTAKRRQVWRQRWISVAVPLCLTLALAVVMFIQVRAWEQERTVLTFEWRAETLAQTFEKNIHGYPEVLYAIGSFYASSQEVERHEFHAFVKRAFSRYPGIQALEWIPRVPDVERATYEEAARQGGYPDFQMTERHTQGHMVQATRHPEYFPVYYVEPYEGNELALGFNLASNPTRLEALRLARDTGEMVATARITLVQESGQQFGFLVFLPIYRNGLPHDTVAARRRNLRGFVLGVFRTGDMVEAAVKTLEQEGIELQLSDETAPDGERLLYVHRAQTQEATVPSVDNEHGETGGLHWNTTLEIAGRQWMLRFSPSPEYLAAQKTWQAWTVLAGGLLFTGLLGAFLLVATGRTAHITQLVDERTAELSCTNAALGREIAERKRAEEQIQTYARELEERNTALAHSNRELEDFAYIASHDLKEPLRGIHNYATFLVEDYADRLDDEGHAKLQTLTRLTQRMEDLIDSLLYYSRVGRVDLAMQETDLAKVVAGVIESLAIRLQDEDVAVRLPTPLPTIHCDTARVGEIFRNLLTNAMKYNDKAQKWIEIGVVGSQTQVEHETRQGRAAARHPGPWVFYVRDNGIGIREKHQETIFRIFKRLHTRDKYGGGTGAGLTIVKKIVERHGGRMWIESAVGEGTTFYFTLKKEE